MNWKIIINFLNYKSSLLYFSKIKKNKNKSMDYKKAHDIIKNQRNENDNVTIKKIDRLKISNNMKIIIKIYLKNSYKIPSFLTYTITGRNDGFGSQYLSVMSGIAYCEYMKYKYIHTAFKNIAHNADVKSLNKFIGIPISNNIKIDVEEKLASEVKGNPKKYYTSEVLKIIKNYYYSTPKPNISNIEIAIHIRRGDINKSSIRYTDNNKYKELISFLLEKYPDYKITIYSEGNINDFNELINDRVLFSLNKNIEDTYHSLVTAKVLVIAKSAFSYSAAMLNENIIYYMDFPYKPLDHWIILK